MKPIPREVLSWGKKHWFPAEYVLVTLQIGAKVRLSVGQICPILTLPNVFMHTFLPNGSRVKIIIRIMEFL